VPASKEVRQSARQSESNNFIWFAVFWRLFVIRFSGHSSTWNHRRPHGLCPKYRRFPRHPPFDSARFQDRTGRALINIRSRRANFRFACEGKHSRAWLACPRLADSRYFGSGSLAD